MFLQGKMSSMVPRWVWVMLKNGHPKYEKNTWAPRGAVGQMVGSKFLLETACSQDFMLCNFQGEGGNDGKKLLSPTQ